MKKRIPLTPVIIAVVILVLSGALLDPLIQYLGTPSDVRAVGGYSALDELGQTDGADHAVFTTNAPDDGGVTNAHGISTAPPNGPHLALDAVHHRLFIADQNNNRVLVFNLDTNNRIVSHTASAVLCQTLFTANAPATTQSRCDTPNGLAYDSVHDRLFVGDHLNNRVLVFDTATISNGEAAVNVIGRPDFTTTTGGTTINRLLGPWGLTYDMHERLFVVDNSNNRVIVFNVDPSVLIPNNSATDGPNAINVIGQALFTTSGAATTQSGLNLPVGVAYDGSTDRLSVADASNNRVMLYNASTAVLIANTPATDGPNAINVIGQTLFTTNGSATTQSGLNFPVGVAYDSSTTRLYVGDSANNRVMIFDNPVSNGPLAIDVIGQSSFTTNDFGTTQTSLTTPYGLAASGGRVFVIDVNNNRMMMFDFNSGATPTPTPVGGRHHPHPTGFVPKSIVVNNDAATTDSRNVLVTVDATFTNSFQGVIQVLLSNTPDFSTFIPFTYDVPEYDSRGLEVNRWPKTVAWDLCFGLPVRQCDPGRRTVYARFYVNSKPPQPAFTPTPSPLFR